MRKYISIIFALSFIGFADCGCNLCSGGSTTVHTSTHYNDVYTYNSGCGCNPCGSCDRVSTTTVTTYEYYEPVPTYVVYEYYQPVYTTSYVVATPIAPVTTCTTCY